MAEYVNEKIIPEWNSMIHWALHCKGVDEKRFWVLRCTYS